MRSGTVNAGCDDDNSPPAGLADASSPQSAECHDPVRRVVVIAPARPKGHHGLAYQTVAPPDSILGLAHDQKGRISKANAAASCNRRPR
jgi:hypothetical protein